MSYRNLFTSGEWVTLQFSPLWIFTIIAAVDGKVEKKEVMALAKELADAPAFRSELAREVFLNVGLNFDSVWPAYQLDTRNPLAGLFETRQILETKLSSADAEGFKRVLLFIGMKVLEADSKGFLGIKKEKKKEKAALVLAAVTLGITID